MLCRLGLEPGLDYHESVRILENAKRANPELENKIDEAIEYAMYMCSFGASFSDKHGSQESPSNSSRSLDTKKVHHLCSSIHSSFFSNLAAYARGKSLFDNLKARS